MGVGFNRRELIDPSNVYNKRKVVKIFRDNNWLV